MYFSGLICLLCAVLLWSGAQQDDRWIGRWALCAMVGAVGFASSTILLLIVGPRLVERVRQNSRMLIPMVATATALNLGGV